jgi:hypothetical protein
MSDASPITPEIARILADWSGLGAKARPGAELAEVFEAFHQRVQRLYAVDVEPFEFDFLYPTTDEP